MQDDDGVDRLVEAAWVQDTDGPAAGLDMAWL